MKSMVKLGGNTEKHGKESTGIWKRIKRAKWFEDECKKVLEEQDAACLRFLRDPNEGNKIQLAIKQRESKKTIRIKKRQWERNRIEQIESSYRNNSKVFFRGVKEMKVGLNSEQPW